MEIFHFAVKVPHPKRPGFSHFVSCVILCWSCRECILRDFPSWFSFTLPFFLSFLNSCSNMGLSYPILTWSSVFVGLLLHVVFYQMTLFYLSLSFSFHFCPVSAINLSSSTSWTLPSLLFAIPEFYNSTILLTFSFAFFCTNDVAMPRCCKMYETAKSNL